MKLINLDASRTYNFKDIKQKKFYVTVPLDDFWSISQNYIPEEDELLIKGEVFGMTCYCPIMDYNPKLLKNLVNEFNEDFNNGDENYKFSFRPYFLT